MCIWFNTTTFPIDRAVLMTNDTQPSNPQFRISIMSDGSLGIAANNVGNIETNFPVNDGNWHHLVFIKNGSI